MYRTRYSIRILREYDDEMVCVAFKDLSRNRFDLYQTEPTCARGVISLGTGRNRSNLRLYAIPRGAPEELSFVPKTRLMEQIRMFVHRVVNRTTGVPETDIP